MHNILEKYIKTLHLLVNKVQMIKIIILNIFL